MKTLLSGVGAVYLRDLDSVRVTAWLTTLRRGAESIDLPPGEAFTPKTVAAVFGVTVDAVRKWLARHQLKATGCDKARRIPRDVVERLTEQRAKGRAPQTINHYIRAVRSFTRWLVRNRRCFSDPLGTLSLVNVSQDIRRRRRDLTVEELQ